MIFVPEGMSSFSLSLSADSHSLSFDFFTSTHSDSDSRGHICVLRHQNNKKMTRTVYPISVNTGRRTEIEIEREQVQRNTNIRDISSHNWRLCSVGYTLASHMGRRYPFKERSGNKEEQKKALLGAFCTHCLGNTVFSCTSTASFCFLVCSQFIHFAFESNPGCDT